MVVIRLVIVWGVIAIPIVVMVVKIIIEVIVATV